MRVAAQVELTAIERRRLETWSSARSTAVRLVEHSNVLMACAGMTNQAIAKALGIDQNTVGRWRNRFVKERVKGIEKERPRGGNHGGKDSERQAKLRARIIEATTQTTPKDATHWSTRTMARAMGTTHSFVHRVWQSHGLKPHLVRTFKVSNDPRFEEKLHDVVGLYLNPPENALGSVQRRRKELGAGSGQDAAGLADQEGTLRHDDPRLQASWDDYVVCSIGRGHRCSDRRPALGGELVPPPRALHRWHRGSGCADLEEGRARARLARSARHHRQVGLHIIRADEAQRFTARRAEAVEEGLQRAPCVRDPERDGSGRSGRPTSGIGARAGARARPRRSLRPREVAVRQPPVDRHADMDGVPGGRERLSCHDSRLTHPAGTRRGRVHGACGGPGDASTWRRLRTTRGASSKTTGMCRGASRSPPAWVSCPDPAAAPAAPRTGLGNAPVPGSCSPSAR